MGILPGDIPYLCVKCALPRDMKMSHIHEYYQHEEVITPLLRAPMGMGTAGYEWADQRHCLQVHQSTLCLKVITLVMLEKSQHSTGRASSEVSYHVTVSVHAYKI